MKHSTKTLIMVGIGLFALGYCLSPLDAAIPAVDDILVLLGTAIAEAMIAAFVGTKERPEIVSNDFNDVDF